MKKLNQSGLSLIELMIGLGLGAVVSLSGAYVAVQSTQVNNMISLQTELNQEHIIAIQRLKDSESVLERLGINNDDVTQCFSKRHTGGFNCANLNMPNLAGVNFDFATCIGDLCNFEHALEYRLDCTSPGSCTKLELRITTIIKPAVADQKKYYAKARVSHISVSGLMVSSRQQINFNCSNPTGTVGGIITSMMFNTLTANCETFVGVNNCSGNGTTPATPTSFRNPLSQFFITYAGMSDIGNCAQHTMATENCAVTPTTYGFSRLGLFSTQSECNVGGDVTTVTPAVTCGPIMSWTDETSGLGGCTATVGYVAVGGISTATDSNSNPWGGSATANCNADGTWNFTSRTCEQPPTVEQCYTYSRGFKQLDASCDSFPWEIYSGPNAEQTCNADRATFLQEPEHSANAGCKVPNTTPCVVSASCTPPITCKPDGYSEDGPMMNFTCCSGNSYTTTRETGFQNNNGMADGMALPPVIVYNCGISPTAPSCPEGQMPFYVGEYPNNTEFMGCMPEPLIDPCTEGGINGNTACQDAMNSSGGGSICMKVYGRCDAGGAMCVNCEFCPSGNGGTTDGYCKP